MCLSLVLVKRFGMQKWAACIPKMREECRDNGRKKTDANARHFAIILSACSSSREQHNQLFVCQHRYHTRDIQRRGRERERGREGVQGSNQQNDDNITVAT